LRHTDCIRKGEEKLRMESRKYLNVQSGWAHMKAIKFTEELSSRWTRMAPGSDVVMVTSQLRSSGFGVGRITWRRVQLEFRSKRKVVLRMSVS
jgi:hypothetical protein